MEIGVSLCSAATLPGRALGEESWEARFLYSLVQNLHLFKITEGAYSHRPVTIGKHYYLEAPQTALRL